MTHCVRVCVCECACVCVFGVFRKTGGSGWGVGGFRISIGEVLSMGGFFRKPGPRWGRITGATRVCWVDAGE